MFFPFTLSGSSGSGASWYAGDRPVQPQEEIMYDPTYQPPLPLDERFREAEQLALDLDPPQDPRPVAPVVDHLIDGGCPYHRVFVYGCPYCDPR